MLITNKQSLFFAVCLTLVSAFSNAQSFKEDSRVVNVGVGLGRNYYKAFRGAGYKYGGTPVICASYEQAYPKRVGPGLIGIGGLVTYQSTRSKFENYYAGSGYVNAYRWSNYVLAVRGTYHWDEVNTDKYDLYAGLMVGIRLETYVSSTEYSGPVYTGVGNLSGRSTGIYQVGGLFLGGRYYISPAFGVYGELHYGASVPYVNLGLTFKL